MSLVETLKRHSGKKELENPTGPDFMGEDVHVTREMREVYSYRKKLNQNRLPHTEKIQRFGFFMLGASIGPLAAAYYLRHRSKL